MFIWKSIIEIFIESLLKIISSYKHLFHSTKTKKRNISSLFFTPCNNLDKNIVKKNCNNSQIYYIKTAVNLLLHILSVSLFSICR